MKNVIVALLGCAGIFAACGQAKTPRDNTRTAAEPPAVYHKISAEDANKMMSELNRYVILDARTEAEYSERRIEGAELIPHTAIEARAEEELPDRNAVIFVYCQSGGRSAQAARILVKLGYRNVFDFGGIVDWPYKTIGD